MLIGGRSWGCHAGVWKMRERVTGRTQKSQHYLHLWSAKVKEGEAHGGKRLEQSVIPSVPILSGLLLGSPLLGSIWGVSDGGGTEGEGLVSQCT